MSVNEIDIAQRFMQLDAGKRRGFLERLRESGLNFADLPIVAVSRQTALPLSYAQNGLWLTWCLDPASPAYNMPGVLHIEGQLDCAALQDSLHELVARHELLRTVINQPIEGEPTQQVLDNLSVELPFVDLRDVPQEIRLTALCEQASRFAARPFRLDTTVPFRAALFQSGEQCWHLALAVHHIAADGASLHILMQDLFTMYAAQISGKTSNLPELPIQFADYAAWQRNWMEAGERERQLTYWVQQLGNEHPVLELPGARPRTSASSSAEGRHEFTLDTMLSRRLQKLAQASGATLYMAVLALLKLTLYRLTGQPDLRIGSPSDTRSRPETQGMMGYLLNVQVLRTTLKPGQGFTRLLRDVRETVLQAREYGDLPFDLLVAALQPERLPNVHPLFQVKCTQLPVLPEQQQVAGLSIRLEELSGGQSHFDLSFDFVSRPQGLHFMLSYAAGLYDAAVISRLTACLSELAQQVVEDPTQPLRDLALPGAIAICHGEARTYAYADVLALWNFSVKLDHAAPAIRDAQAAYSYGELDAAATQLAAKLVEQGIGMETRVAVHAGRSCEFVLGLLAVLKAGGAYVPLDPQLPTERLAYQLKDSQCQLLLSECPNDIDWAGDVTVLKLDMAIALTQQPVKAAIPIIHSKQTAYVIYTSGSTGQPKGVAVSHGALANYVQGTLQRLALTPDTRSMAMVSTVAADLGHTALFGGLCSGRLLHLLPADSAFDPDHFAAYMQQHSIDVLKIVPSHLQALLHATNAADVLPRQALILGGEATHWSLLQQVRALNPACRVFNHYGPTETTVGVLIQPAAMIDDSAATLPLGKPLPNTYIRVLDDDLQPLPTGVAGELYIGGEGLTRGYLARPGLTAERYVADPLLQGKRLYRSGDRVLQLADGSVEFIGRTDDQVKIRGYRVQLSEIATVLRSLAHVAQTEVITRASDDGRLQLHAYVIAAEGYELDASKLAIELSAHLPDYMVPAIMVLDSLPLTANGKLDRKNLPISEFAGTAQYEAPQGETEWILAELWAEVLGIERIGRNDSFFELGGDSILSLKLVARARKRGMQLLPRQLFELQTIAALAAVLTKTSIASNKSDSVADSIPHADRKQPLILSHAQNRLWFLWRMEPESGAYNIPIMLKLRGTLNETALQQTLNALALRHESLRTTFHEQGGEFVQRIQAAAIVAMRSIDLRSQALDDETLRMLVETEALAPFNLETGPLLRVCLLHMADDAYTLLLTMHHIVSDGWSMNVLVDEFVCLYSACIAGNAVTLPTLPIQYADYAQWQRHRLSAAETERQLTYWKQRLGGEHEVLHLPTDHVRPSVWSYRGADFKFSMSAALTTRLRDFAKLRGVTMFTLLLAAFKVLLYRYSGQLDIKVGYPIANRERLETHGLVGFFVNTQVLRTQIEANGSFADILHQVDTGLREAQESPDIAFEQVVDALQLQRNLSHHPLFQVLYNHQRREFQALRQLPGLSVESLGIGATVAKFDLSLDTSEDDQGTISCSFTYATDLFDATTIARMAQQWKRLLAAAVATPQDKLEELKLLDVRERDSILQAWNPPRTIYQAQGSLQALFEAEAAARPNAIAVNYETQALSYGELNRRANRLAQRLRQSGIVPDTLVGLAAERSLELVVGLLAILKAGAGYLPLDPAYPKERLAYMVQDSGVRIVLAQQSQAALVAEITGGGETWLLEDDLSDYVDTNPVALTHPHHLAYCIYTSGSTGQPKGALLTHHNVLRLFRATQNFNIGRDDVWTLFHSYAFDFSVWELFGALLHGGRLVVVPYFTTRSPEAFHELLLVEGVTILSQTPSAFNQLSQAVLAHTKNLSLALRHIVFGGEALDVSSLAPWIERFGDMAPQLINMYGITETTVHVTYRRITKADLSKAGSQIGMPLPDLSWYLLDGELNPVPPGVFGELYVGGDGLARGYLNRAMLTAERFIPNSFDTAGERLYRTGDAARCLADGSMEYAGRLDQQVKIRGFRIELGEIEAKLRSLGNIADTAVLVRSGSGGDKRLVAYVVLQKEQSGNIEEYVRSGLKTMLPDYMLPAHVITMSSLPLTTNGKLDRNALPQPDFSAAQKDYMAPRNETERILAEAWSTILRLERVGTRDNFFELGGDSIMVIQAVGKTRDLGIHITPKLVFQYQTVQELADAIIADNSLQQPVQQVFDDHVNLSATQLAVLQSGDPTIEDVYPLSPMQQGMLLHTMLNPGTGIYHMQNQYCMQQHVDIDAFRHAWEQVVERHEALRASFRWSDDDAPMQIVQRAVSLPVIVHDWSNMDVVSAELRLQQELKDELLHGFDMAQAPLLTLRLVKQAEQRYYIVFSFHHILVDAWCQSLIFHDFFHYYKGYRTGDTAIQPLPRRFRDFIAWLQQQDPQLAGSFWRNELQGLQSPTPVPFLRKKPAADTTSHIQDLFLSLSQDETDALTGLAKSSKLTVNTFLQGAWALLLHIYSDQQEVMFGVSVAGRPTELEGIENTVGLFINSIPLRVKMPVRGDRTPTGSWLKQLMDKNAALRQFEHLPLVDIQAQSEMPYGISLFDSLLVYENAPFAEEVSTQASEFAIHRISTRTHTNYPMTVVVYPGREIRLHLSYDTHCFREEEAELLLQAYKRLLLAQVSEFEEELDSLTRLSEGEAEQLAQWNNSADPSLEVHSSYSRLFEAQVTLHGSRIAAACMGEQLSYDALNARANRIAHALRDAGVQPDDTVTLLNERGLDLLSGIIGSFKAGAAYLALDPSHPAKRLVEIVRLAQPRAILCGARFTERLQAILAELPVDKRPAMLMFEQLATQGISECNPGLYTGARNLAYVIYTSGSTGVPKGAMVEQSGMLNNQLSKIPYFGLTSNDVIAQTASSNFDISVWQFLTAMLCGARVEIVPDAIAHDPWSLIDHVTATGITVLESVPSLIQSMLDCDSSNLDSLRWMIPTGEALAPELARRWLKRLPNIPLANAYGPAECADDVAMHTLNRVPAEHVIHVPIGRPTANNQLYIVNNAFEPLPVGAVGELCVAGLGLGRGYLNDPARTAQSFVPNPFDAQGSRLYRTGDLALMRPDGLIEYVGRIDHQVKIRGFRIELGEIEAQLLQQSNVRQAVVVAQSSAGGDRLVAYVSSYAGHTLMPELLAAALSSALPEYMVPSIIAILDSLPLNANGKVDRKALPAAEFSNKENYAAPQGRVETLLAGIWSEVLSVERVGRHDNFFALGGHSLAVIQVQIKVSKAFPIKPPLNTYFTQPVLSMLATRIEQEIADSGAHQGDLQNISELLDLLED